MPRYKRTLDTNDHPVGQDTAVTAPVTGDARLERAKEVEPVTTSDINPEWAAEMRFMEEPVTIRIHETTNPNDERWIPIFNNGRAQYVLRGVETTVKRKFVEVLLNAKKTTYRNQEDRDMDGNLRVTYPSMTGLMYPFQVLRDDNPKGAEWLKRKLAQA